MLTRIFLRFVFEIFVHTEAGVDPFERLQADLSGDSQTMTSSLTSNQSNNNLERWEDKHVRLLMECYMKCTDQLKKPQQDQQSIRSLQSENVVPFFTGWPGGLRPVGLI